MPNTPCNICTIREGVGWLNFKITSCRLTEKTSAYAFPWLDFWDNMTGFTITPLHFIMATSILLISHKLRCHYTHYAKYNKIRLVVITLFSEVRVKCLWGKYTCFDCKDGKCLPSKQGSKRKRGRINQIA